MNRRNKSAAGGIERGIAILVPICSNHIMFAQDLHHNQIVTFDFDASFTSPFMYTIMEFYLFQKKTERHAAQALGAAGAPALRERFHNFGHFSSF
jgi:hypothetical protein